MLVGVCLNGVIQIIVIDKNWFIIIIFVMNYLWFVVFFEVLIGSLGFKSYFFKFWFWVYVEI